MRIIVVIVLAFMAVLALAQPISEADAARATVDCATDDLQAAIDNAAPGTRMQVRGTCVGNFTINKDLRLVGHHDATMRGDKEGAVLTVTASAHVVLTNVTITGGKGNTIDSPSYARRVGGIDNAGVLSLNGSTHVTANMAFSGVGGVSNAGTLIMNDRSRLSYSGAAYGFGGISNTGLLVLNDQASIDHNVTGCAGCTVGGVANGGVMVMNDRSSVHDNSTTQFGGGILNTGTLTINNRSSIHNNDSFRGAGVYNYGKVTLNNRSSVRDNTAGGSGGGIENHGGTVVGWLTRVFGNTPDQCNGC